MSKSSEDLDNDGAASENRNGGHRNSHSKRIRTNFSEFQLRRLDETFAVRPFPGRDLINKLSDELGLSYFSIKTWFQNKRSKSRRNGTFDLDVSASTAGNEPTRLSDSSTPIQNQRKENTGQESSHSIKPPLVTAHSNPWSHIKTEVAKETDAFSIDAILAKEPSAEERFCRPTVRQELNFDDEINNMRDAPQLVAEENQPKEEEEYSHVAPTVDSQVHLNTEQVTCYGRPHTNFKVPDETVTYPSTNGNYTNNLTRYHFNNNKANEDVHSAMYNQYGCFYFQSAMYSYPCYEYCEKTNTCDSQAVDDVEEPKCTLVCDLDSHQIKEVKREQFPDVHPTNHHVLSWNYMY